MSTTTQAFGSALAEARSRAQREKREVICFFAGDDSAPFSRDLRGHGRCDAPGIRAIVRPDEPIVFCGVLPG